MKRYLAWPIFLLLISAQTYAEGDSTPCQSLIDIIGRPSNADSACTVPYTKALLELGFAKQSLLVEGNQTNSPQAVFRIGLPKNSEFSFILPNYADQSVEPYSGLNATTLVLKHIINANPTWMATVEGLVTLPSGSEDYGNDGLGEAINGILSYNLSSTLSITAMIGISSTTTSTTENGRRFQSINPDLVLSWSKNKTQIFGEVFAQSKTSPDQNWGMNVDTGIIYLIKDNITVDFEVGRKISGELGGYNNYIGAGIAILLG